MPELFSQKLKANFTPEQQDYYLQLANELKELLGGQTQEEVLASGDPKIIQKILKIKQEMLHFVLTKKTREMVRQEDMEKFEREKRSIRLDEIERKQNEGEELTNNELKFLYLIDGFGREVLGDRQREGRVRRIIRQLKNREIVAKLLDCDEAQISFDTDDFLSRDDILYHFGDLDLQGFNYLPEYFSSPQVVNGYMNLSGLRILPNNILLPVVINGYFSLPELEEWPINTKFPKVVNGDLDLGGMKNLPDIDCFPKFVGGDLFLNNITTISEKTKLPQVLIGTLYLPNLVTIDGLDLSPGIRSVYFRALPVIEQEKFKKKYPLIKIKTPKDI